MWTPKIWQRLLAFASREDEPAMRNSARIGIWTAVIVASASLHLVAFGLTGGRRDGFGGKPRKPASLVEMTVAPPPPPPEATPEPAKAPSARPVARASRVARVNQPAAAPPEAPAAETPADFTGTTLTNDGPGTGWASATGNGEAMRGPVGRPGAEVTGRSADGAAASGIPIVGAGNLARPPEAPDLGGALERAYPTEARRKGLAGTARVRLRVMPEGDVRELSLIAESAPGFGEACRQILRGSRWSAPLDRGGQPVSTFVQYTCRFEVR
jgi:protein TonB